ncbi:hypothetical protein CWB96_10955 [Pseudoalteromonas citrea]|uniref:Uncharacterized protein n=1 Tax=Pseudoalteromonas citrea TaxID=43655 RepID=A0A5S3XS37_9GAMM|nr:putative capsular polysaccharide synthesis family protein [Pseudoalteromonas citrea]TMP45695.1 hypothetical protein CWB97_03600 [Pseudoalteromonas citrea]TMP59074.1 hypothetical protein CWB96_10955 [Pseudoalteromonas citrea]
MLRRIAGYKALYKKYHDPKSIFVYQMGKVGSTALEQSIDNAIHIHNFYSKSHPCSLRLKGLAGFGWRYYLKRLEQEFELFIKRLAFRRRAHTKIVTLVRPALERNISMFFHDLDCYLYALYSNCDRTKFSPMATRTQDPQALIKAFEMHYQQSYPLTWFDDELKKMTGLDIYAEPFDMAKGLVIVRNNNFEVMCLDIKVLPKSTEQLSDFLGQSVVLKRANQAQSKWYAALYGQFKCNYTPSPELTQLLKNSKYSTHFFK